MSDSAEGGESGGATGGGGQDAEADAEPPHLVPQPPKDDLSDSRGTPEEVGEPSAKRPRLNEEEQEHERTTQPMKMEEKTPAQPAQSTVSEAACLCTRLKE